MNRRPPTSSSLAMAHGRQMLIAVTRADGHRFVMTEPIGLVFWASGCRGSTAFTYCRPAVAFEAIRR